MKFPIVYYEIGTLKSFFSHELSWNEIWLSGLSELFEVSKEILKISLKRALEEVSLNFEGLKSN